MIAGIDYGSKLAGTTAIAWLEGDSLQIRQSEKKKDADAFLKDLLTAHQFKIVGLDAPLSLPAKLLDKNATGDYFYREADKVLNAMSPMFLGGLTARALKLRDELEASVETMIEAYPKAFVQQLGYRHLYQKKALATLQDFYGELQKEYPHIKYPRISNWHQLDAILAFLIADKYQKGTHSMAGDEREGVIIY
ncbi:MAG: hypothetical protein AAFO69_00210 [Bacteroidota bacterium]